MNDTKFENLEDLKFIIKQFKKALEELEEDD